VNEITYNAGLVGELRAIHFVQELLKAQRIDKRRYKNLRLHMIADEEGLAPLQQSSKLNTDRNFLLALHELGRLAAQAWLEKDARKVGRESSLDIKKTFLDKR
jgi:NTE family protein